MTYQSINDAANTHSILSVGEVKVHYANNSITMDASKKDSVPYKILAYTRFGVDKFKAEYGASSENVLKENINVTHTCIGSIKGGDMEDVFIALQGENWSPNGEARTLIRSKNADHTSMSCGDILETQDGFYVVAFSGFEKV